MSQIPAVPLGGAGRVRLDVFIASSIVHGDRTGILKWQNQLNCFPDWEGGREEEEETCVTRVTPVEPERPPTQFSLSGYYERFYQEHPMIINISTLCWRC